MSKVLIGQENAQQKNKPKISQKGESVENQAIGFVSQK